MEYDKTVDEAGFILVSESGGDIVAVFHTEKAFAAFAVGCRAMGHSIFDANRAQYITDNLDQLEAS